MGQAIGIRLPKEVLKRIEDLNSDGFIITSYFTDVIRKINRVVVYEKSFNEL